MITRALLLIIVPLLLTPVLLQAQVDISGQTKTAWRTYLAASPRDQETKHFIEQRIRTFIDNLEELESKTGGSGNNSGLSISQTMNEIKRDYTMLEATIRNLDRLTGEGDPGHDADLNLLISLGEIFGQANVLAER